jgi:hypothetical protein
LNAEEEKIRANEAFGEKWQRPWNRLTPYNGGFNLTPQLPEAYQSDEHLILIGDSDSSTLIRALQASELLTYVVDKQYPGDGRAVIQFAWSPFGLERNVIVIGASDPSGVNDGVDELSRLAR